MKTTLKNLSLVVFLAPALMLIGLNTPSALGAQDVSAGETQTLSKEKAMLIEYLEIVSTDVDATCSALGKMHGVGFGKPEAALGNARIAKLKNGGRIGVRAPMREDEEPVVRPYILVDNIESAVETAEASGGEFAMYPTEIPGHGKFAIYFQGGIQYGLWEL